MRSHWRIDGYGWGDDAHGMDGWMSGCLMLSAWAAVCLMAPSLAAQQQELTPEDRLARLYAPQLDFAKSGDPMVRVGLDEGRESVQFEPTRPIRVMPRGEEGPRVVLPADHSYTVEIDRSEAGAYRHWVIVEELTMANRDRKPNVLKEWRDRGYVPKTFQVGGLFGIRGKVFDSRRILIGVSPTESYDEARETRRSLESQYGIDGRLHSDVTEYPTGRLTLTGEGVEAEVRYRDVMWIAPADETSTESDASEEEIRYRIEGLPALKGEGERARTFTGRLVLSPDREGKLAVINKLGVERLLKGVVPSEIYASAPQEALRAQAVAARNTVMGAVGVRNLADPYMLRADVYDQVYGGIGAEVEATSRAVEATRGEVMFYGKQIVQGVYSANAGGFTENNEDVWDAEPKPYLRGGADAPDDEVPEAFRDGIDADELSDFLSSDFPAFSESAPASSSKYYRWSATVGAAEAREWLEATDRDVRRIKRAEVTERGDSGRVVRLKLTGANGATTVVERELNVRRLFGNLKSGLFTMDVERGEDGFIEEFDFRGAGYGHGVGMCQTGAIGMAAKGRDHREILKHYYTGIDIEQLY